MEGCLCCFCHHGVILKLTKLNTVCGHCGRWLLLDICAPVTPEWWSATLEWLLDENPIHTRMDALVAVVNVSPCLRYIQLMTGEMADQGKVLMFQTWSSFCTTLAIWQALSCCSLILDPWFCTGGAVRFLMISSQCRKPVTAPSKIMRCVSDWHWYLCRP